METTLGVHGSYFSGLVQLASHNLYRILAYDVANYRLHLATEAKEWTPACHNFLPPKIPKMCNPILVTLFKITENATP